MKLTKIENVDYHISKTSFLFTKKIDSFKIVKKINDFVYKFEFSNIMKIHDVIFVIHFEQTINDFYQREIFSFALIVDEMSNEL